MKIMDYINTHREDLDPCECVILPDGEIEEPLPSHIGKLEELAGEDKSVLNRYMEKNMEPLFWMVEYTRCLCVWSSRVVAPFQITQEQEATLEELHDAAFLEPRYLLEQADETYRDSVRKALSVNNNEKAGELPSPAASLQGGSSSLY